MWETFRRLSLGLVLIAAASALLLVSDLGSRAKTEEASARSGKKTASVAVLQHASQAILDQGREGMAAGLAEQGWVLGKNLELKRYNAEGDMPVAQAIAREMANGGHDLLLTISTPSLQAVANANRSSKVPHVFALVTDPKAAGVGITAPREHPPWIAGFGTMQPVVKAFETARTINPDLRSVGVVWNAAEANSEAQIKLARKVCQEMGISLSEATVENSAGVGEAAASLTARGVEAIWVNGDVTVITAIDAVIAAANKAGIPVFTVIPPNVKRGALFDLGADYREVGRLAGVLAGEILNGKDPADVAIENVMPEIQTVNLQTAKRLNPGWNVPQSLIDRAQIVIDENGTEHLAAQTTGPGPAAPPNPSGKTWRIAVIVYNENLPTEETIAGMDEAWSRSPLVKGRDYTIRTRSAQGDIAALGGIIDAALTDGADIVVPLSTPSLQAAIHKIRHIPVVFSLIANPIAAGAGKSYEDHLPNITGVSVLSPAGEMLDLLEKYYPAYKRIGTLYCPAEANSVDLKNSLEAMCQKRGFVLESIAANSPGELPDAALALVSRPIDAVVQISDNLTSGGFTAIAKAARQAKKPLFSLNSTTIPLGAAVAIGRDYHAAGIATVGMIERVIRGENPRDIPFLLPPVVVRGVSLPNARAVNMTVPPGLIREADKVIE
ncbi:MAG TPA: ABC transporter substrate-binding protein [Terrimicrobiaceae bacterium]|nr:ABC transporter substrate-binding protein [Terrimicrobiaceae bacterium]